MSIDVETFAAWVSRPGATPAPTAGGNESRPDTGPGNGGRPGPCVTGYVDTTPANLGLDGDPVAHALHALSLFGELTPREARILLSQWARRDQLTDAQAAEVLAYYQPAPARKAVA